MAHLSGAFLIDCPGSALNNFGKEFPMTRPSRQDQNWSATKYIKTKAGVFPYVSAQAFRYWLRETLKEVKDWSPSPIFREDSIAYTDANPIDFAEDDLFGYMRAPGSTKQLEEKWVASGMTPQEKKKKKEKPPGKQETNEKSEKDIKDKFVTLTRASPFKVSTLMSIASVAEMGYDFGSMSRGEGNPVPYVHEFYRTTLVGLFSVDLRMAGRFYHVDRTRFRHLDEVRKKLATDRGLQTYDDGKAFELSLDTRKARIIQLLDGLGRISGGAKQALHYTDVAPKLLFLAVAKGGNHFFGNAIGANPDGTPLIQTNALEEVAKVFPGDLLSGFYAGLCQGYLDKQRPDLKAVTDGLAGSFLGHPVEAVRQLSQDLEKNASTWLA